MRTDIIRARGYAPDIAGSELSLKIASYPASAHYLAGRIGDKDRTVCELCCGIGVSLIELAQAFAGVIGVDNDAYVLADCRRNLRAAGVANSKLLHGDVADRQLLGSIQADIVLYDIPYWSVHGGAVNPARQNPDLKRLVGDIRELITQDVVIYAPPHFTYEAAASMLGAIDFNMVYLNGKHDRNFIFLGGLGRHVGKHTVSL